MLCVAGAFYLASHARFATSLASFMPPGKTQAQRLMLTQMQDSPATRAVLIGISGGTPLQRAAASQAYAHALKASDQFVRVANGAFKLDASDDNRLFAWRYLLSPAVKPADFTVDGLHTALKRQLDALNSPLGMLTQRYLAADPTGSYLTMLSAWKPAQAPKRQAGIWVSPDGRIALLLAQTRAPGLDLDAMQQVVKTLHRRFDALPQARDLRLILSGTPVIAVHSRDIIKADAQAFSGAASLALMLLLLLAYRSLRLLVLAALPLLSAVLAGTVAVNLGFGEVQGITLAFGSTLLGVAVDYPMHLFSHLDRNTPARHSLAHIWPTLRLGVLTTAAGYVGLLGTHFTGLMQLGVFAIAGLLAAAAVTRWVLPQLLPPGYAPVLRLHTLVRISEAARRMPIGTKSGLALALALISLGSLWLHRGHLWEDNLAALSPVSPASLATDRRLRADLNAPDVGQLVIIEARDAQTVLARSQALAHALKVPLARGWLRGDEMAARYLPDITVQQRRQAAIPPAPVLAERLQRALVGLPFRPGVFQPFLESAEAARHLSPVTPADARGTLLSARIDNLLYKQGGHWYALVPLIGVSAPQTLAHWFATHPAPGVTYLDTHAESTRLMHSFREQTVGQLGMVAATILLVLFIGLRRPREVARVLVPLALAELIDLAVLVTLGERLTLFHLIALLMVAGISIDYALFFARPAPDPLSRKRTLHALTLCAASTIGVFGILALSSLPVLRALGLTAAIGVGTAYPLAMMLAQRNSPQTATGRTTS
ncbi:hypothetical protein BI364_16275 [Acidihalobacter yilgarnensis]|uniref:Membrane transport protein MMPL domain-containing protein n=2 Tax=Acidihalobacter yilgarnensis TaxID=2819280 RepID=A0A1D8ITR8_9GAMM|nr:hypothetical protein BI364_16275 [Acidihalobacter yilgarnensis]